MGVRACTLNFLVLTYDCVIVNYNLCFSWSMQFIAVLFAVGGIVLFAYEDRFGSAGWLGVLLSLGSAVGAALYKVRHSSQHNVKQSCSFLKLDTAEVESEGCLTISDGSVCVLSWIV